jgi:hypothetical protein
MLVVEIMASPASVVTLIDEIVDLVVPPIPEIDGMNWGEVQAWVATKEYEMNILLDNRHKKIRLKTKDEL